MTIALPYFPQIKIPAATFIFCAVIALLDRNYFAMLALCAAAAHEAGHAAALMICRVKIKSIVLYPFGADIIPEPGIRSYRADLFTVSAGIAVNLLLGTVCVLFGDSIKTVSFGACNLVLAVFNCLPIRIFDGGMILENILVRRFDAETVDRLQKRISFITLTALWAWSVYLMLFGGENISLFLMCVYLFIILFIARR